MDPRPPIKYLKGHIQGAVNVPIARLRDKESMDLLPEQKLLQILGDSGINEEVVVILYDSYDGQNGAMLAWILDYLGHPDVRLVATFFEAWVESGWPIMYRPVKVGIKSFHGSPKRELRANWQNVAMGGGKKLLDLRSEDEFKGRTTTETRAGHLPGAINLPWTDLLGSSHRFLRPANELESVASRCGLSRSDSVITYCAYGPRATIGYIALQKLGFQSVRVYDGSFHDWARRPDLGVEE